MDGAEQSQKGKSNAEKPFWPRLSTEGNDYTAFLFVLHITISMLIVNSDVLLLVVVTFVHFNSEFFHFCLATFTFCSAHNARIQLLHCCCKTSGNLVDIGNDGGGCSSDRSPLVVENGRHWNWKSKNFYSFN